MTSDSTPAHIADTAISVAAHLEAELEEALAEHRLTRASFLVLDALDQAADGTLGQGALVRSIRRTAGTMSVRLGRLERARLIEREPDPDNRRSVTVSITERGRTLVGAARPAYIARAERLVAGLPEGAAAALDAWLAYFEPAERETPRLGVAIGTTAMAKRMRSAVGLPEEPGVLVLRVGRETRRQAPGSTAAISSPGPTASRCCRPGTWNGPSRARREADPVGAARRRAARARGELPG